MWDSKVSNPKSTKDFSPRNVSRFVETADNKLVLVKDRNFFRDKTWNNSYLASAKMYDFYHKNENDQKLRHTELKRKMKQEELDGKMAHFETMVIKNKYRALESLKNVSMQRVLLQKESGQPIIDRHFDGIQRILQDNPGPQADKKSTEKHKYTMTSPTIGSLAEMTKKTKFTHDFNMIKLMDRKPSSIWNKLTNLNSKNLDMLITPMITKMDKKAFLTIRKKEELEKEKQDILLKRKGMLHDAIRNKNKTFVNKENMVSEVKHESKQNQFVKYDNPAFNGLIMNDILRVKGIANLKIVGKMLRCNSLLRIMKSEALKTLETNKSPLNCQTAQKITSVKNNNNGDFMNFMNFSKDDEKCDIHEFEQNVRKHNKFKESRYPKVNLMKIAHYLQKN